MKWVKSQENQVILSWSINLFYAVHLRCLKFFFFLNLFSFTWRIVSLQCCISFCHKSTGMRHRYTHIPSLLNLLPTSHPIHPFLLLQSSSLSSLIHTSNSQWLSILDMVVCMSPCYSCHSSHPLLPASHVRKSILYVYIFIAALQRGWSMLFPSYCK